MKTDKVSLRQKDSAKSVAKKDISNKIKKSQKGARPKNPSTSPAKFYLLRGETTAG